MVAARATSTTRPRPAAATPTTAGSAASWRPRPAGRCTEHAVPGLAAAGRRPRRPAGRRAGRACPTARWCCSTAWSPAGSRRSRAGGRPAAAGRAGAPAAGRRDRAARRAAAELDAPGAADAAGRHGGGGDQRGAPPARWSAGTACPRTGCTSPRPGWTRPPLATGHRRRRPRLLCVAAVTPRKGQDVLVEALAELADRPGRWPASARWPRPRLRRRAARPDRPAGLDDRVRLAGPLHRCRAGRPLRRRRPAVLASRTETYGMVVTEALARGIPVLATPRPALPDTLGHAPGRQPARPAGPARRPGALAAALRRWLDDAALRYRLRRPARRAAGHTARVGAHRTSAWTRCWSGCAAAGRDAA